MPRVLITGAAGFIGMHTAIKFLREGYEVIGLDNFNDYYTPLLKEDRINKIVEISNITGMKFTLFRRDLNSNVWQQISKYKIDVLIHLAAQAGVRYSLENPNAYLNSNILGFQKVLDFVNSNCIRAFLYASSSSVYGNNAQQPFNEENEPCDSPESYYAATKRMNELMAYSYHKTKEINSVGLRFFTVYGPWGRPDMAPMLFAKAALNNKPIRVFNHGKQERDFTYVDDIVDGIFLVAISSIDKVQCEVVNIGRGEPIGLMNFINILENELGIKIKKTFESAQKGDVVTTYADISKISDKFGYSPNVGLKVGIKHFVKWLKENNYECY
jgi:UDP-glucuronate 4-epimerase